MDAAPRTRKIVIAVLVVILILIINPITVFAFVMHNSSISRQERIVPYDYPGTVWESEEPFLHLEVPDEPGEIISGYAQSGDETIDVCFSITTGPGAVVFDESKKVTLMKVDCRYSEESIVMKVGEDHLFGGDYKTITLNRKDAQQCPPA